MKENQEPSTVRKIITVCSYPFKDKQTIYHGATRMINEKLGKIQYGKPNRNIQKF